MIIHGSKQFSKLGFITVGDLHNEQLVYDAIGNLWGVLMTSHRQTSAEHDLRATQTCINGAARPLADKKQFPDYILTPKRLVIDLKPSERQGP